MDAWKSISDSTGFVSIWLCVVLEKSCGGIRSEWNKEFRKKDQDVRFGNDASQLLLLRNVCFNLLDCCIEFGLIQVLNWKTIQNPMDSGCYWTLKYKCYNVCLFFYLICFDCLKSSCWRFKVCLSVYINVFTKALFVIEVQKKVRRYLPTLLQTANVSMTLNNISIVLRHFEMVTK